MKLIYKYPLYLQDVQAIAMPLGAKIIKADVQKHELWLWAIIDDQELAAKRMVAVIGTGNPIDKTLDLSKYIDTVQMDNFVWHVFDLGEM